MCHVAVVDYKKQHNSPSVVEKAVTFFCLFFSYTGQSQTNTQKSNCKLQGSVKSFSHAVLGCLKHLVHSVGLCKLKCAQKAFKCWHALYCVIKLCGIDAKAFWCNHQLSRWYFACMSGCWYVRSVEAAGASGFNQFNSEMQNREAKATDTCTMKVHCK